MTEKCGSTLGRDIEIGWELHPREMGRLETLKNGLETHFDIALKHALTQHHLLPWTNGTHLLYYQPGISPVGFQLRCNTKTKTISILGLVGKLDCSRFVEVQYEFTKHAQDAEKNQPSDCQVERAPAPQVESGWWG